MDFDKDFMHDTKQPSHLEDATKKKDQFDHPLLSTGLDDSGVGNFEFIPKGSDIDSMHSDQLTHQGPLVDDFLSKPGTEKTEVNPLDDAIFRSMPIHKTTTHDFLNAERLTSNFPSTMKPPTDPLIPVAATTNLLIDDIQDDYMNPYASTAVPSKNSEKFISSENLLDDFRDTKSKTPDLIDERSTNVTKPTKIIDDMFDSDDDDFIVKQSGKPEVAHNEPKKTMEEVKIESKPEPVKIEPVKPEPVKVEPLKPESVAPTKPVEEIKPVLKTEATKHEPSRVEEIKPVQPAQKPAVAPRKEQMISAEEMFCRIGLDAWFKPERLHPKVESLIYWRDPKKSGIVFGVGLVLLLAISFFSVISVFAYVSLITLAGTISFRIYKNVLQAVQKTSEGHPFKEYLDFELTLPQDKVQQVANVGVVHLNAVLVELRRLFLVEDLIDSVKFGVMLWCFTYLGAWFNGMTLVILAFVALFTLPKVYENNKQSIDSHLDLVRSKILEITEKVKAAVPIGKKQDSDKDK